MKGAGAGGPTPILLRFPPRGSTAPKAQGRERENDEIEVAKRASQTSTGVKQAHRPGALRQAAVSARTAQRGDIRQAMLSHLSIAQVSAGHPAWSEEHRMRRTEHDPGERSHRLGLDPIFEADFQVFDARNVADEVGDHVHGG